MKTITITLLAAAAAAIGEGMLSYGMRGIGRTGLAGRAWWPIEWGLTVATNRAVVMGVAFLFTFFVLYLIALSWADLSYVMPLTAASYLFAAFIARYFLGEQVGLLRWIGVVIIVLGIVLIALAGEPQAQAGSRSMGGRARITEKDTQNHHAVSGNVSSFGEE